MQRIVWTEQAKADVRRFDKVAAMRVLHALDRFVQSGAGDVKALKGAEELRLRVGDYRLFFVYLEENIIEVRRVRPRGEAYR